ncbi:MAG: TonB family protein [Azospirillaceae bacterium]|nr:TonB family protein [Azospirillaceae bacterium]
MPTLLLLAGCAQHAGPPTTAPPSHVDHNAPLAADGPKLDPASLMRAVPSFPWVAAHQGETGTVTVALLCMPDGRVTDAEMMDGSGSDRLDAAALAAAESGKWRCMPGAVPQTRPAWITVRYSFKLRDRKDGAAPPPDVAPGGPLGAPSAVPGPTPPPRPALGARIDDDTVIPPPYPADALPTRERGNVPFKFLCGTDGRVLDAQLTQPAATSVHPHLDAAVLAAAQAGAWRCSPSKRPDDHQPMESWGFDRLSFTAPDADAPDVDTAEIDPSTLRRADYTIDAAQAGEEGRVIVSFLCGVNERLGDFKITQSSGHPRLDAAVLATLRSAEARCVPAASRATSRIQVAPGFHEVNFQLGPTPPQPGDAPLIDFRSALAAPPAFPTKGWPKDTTASLTVASLCGPEGTLLDNVLLEGSGHPDLDAAFLAATNSGLWRCYPARLRSTGVAVATWIAVKQRFGGPETEPRLEPVPMGAVLDPQSVLPPPDAPGPQRSRPKAWLRFRCGASGRILDADLFRSSGDPRLDADLMAQARSGKWHCLPYHNPESGAPMESWGFFPYAGPTP